MAHNSNSFTQHLNMALKAGVKVNHWMDEFIGELNLSEVNPTSPKEVKLHHKIQKARGKLRRALDKIRMSQQIIHKMIVRYEEVE